jgi:hypothetical protein
MIAIGRLTVALFALWGLWLAVAPPAHAASEWPVQVGSVSSLERMRPISEAVLGKRPATEAEIQDMLAACTNDPDAWVRRQCVGTIASILTINAMPGPPPDVQWATRLRGVGEALRPALLEALDDPEPRIRVEALRGVVAPLTQVQRPTPLPVEIVRMLSARFHADDSPLVRGAIVGTVSQWPPSDDPEVLALGRRMIVAALRETEPAVIQPAAFGVTRSQPPEALPLLVEQLKHPSHAVRMVVAQGIAAYGASARPYLPQLEAALAAETDDITRKTLGGTISVITR